VGERDFSIDLTAGRVTCPAGRSAPIRVAASGARRASFPRAGCAGCALAVGCLSPDGRRQLPIEPREDLLVAGIAAMSDPDERERFRRTRPRIERLLSLLAHRYGARKGRYLGQRKSLLQAAWSAALVNLNPIGAALRAQTT
jgi:hypothetical protein